MPDAKDEKVEKPFLKGRVSSDNFDNSADATAARQSSANDIQSALDQNLDKHSGSAGGHGLSLEICFKDEDGTTKVLDSRELAEKAQSRAKNVPPSQSISRAELELLSAKGEFAATRALERFADAKTDQEVNAAQDGADRLFNRGKYTPGSAGQIPETQKAASVAEPPSLPLENAGTKLLKGSVQMGIELLKVDVGIVHGTANFAVNSIAGIGNAIRIASAANFELSPIGKLCPDLYFDTEATKMYHDALKAISGTARVMTQLATTFNPQSPLFGVEFDPDGAALTRTLALSLPKHIHDEFEKFGQADTEAKSAVVTEAFWNIATLLETGGAGAVAKGAEIEKFGAFTKVGGDLVDLSSVSADIALHSKIISSLSEKSQALKPLAEKFKECLNDLNEFTKPVLVAEGVGEVRTGKGIIDDFVDIGKDVKDAAKPVVSKIDDYINYMKGKGKGDSGNPEIPGGKKGEGVEKTADDIESVKAAVKLSDAEYTSKLFSENRAEVFKFDYGLKRLRRTDFDELRKPYEWEAHGERFSLDAVRQLLNHSCVHACGEMLSEGRLKQAELIAKYGSPMGENTLVKELGPGWDASTVEVGEELARIDEFSERGSWMAIVYDMTGRRGHHAIVIDGKSPSGNLMVRDPFEGTKYEMTLKEFLGKPLWTGRCVYRASP